jgi:hypothetical protein
LPATLSRAAQAVNHSILRRNLSGLIVDMASRGFYPRPAIIVPASGERTMLRKTFALILCTTLVFAGISTRVSAAVITTRDAVALEARQLQIAGIGARLAQDDVRAAMVELGVDPQQAQLRVAALSDRELAELDARLDSLPAGEGALALIGAVFLVLIILELTGVIDIFKKV